jgi:hypothetical protein
MFPVRYAGVPAPDTGWNANGRPVFHAGRPLLKRWTIRVYPCCCRCAWPHLGCARCRSSSLLRSRWQVCRPHSSRGCRCWACLGACCRYCGRLVGADLDLQWACSRLSWEFVHVAQCRATHAQGQIAVRIVFRLGRPRRSWANEEDRAMRRANACPFGGGNTRRVDRGPRHQNTKPPSLR